MMNKSHILLALFLTLGIATLVSIQPKDEGTGIRFDGDDQGYINTTTYRNISCNTYEPYYKWYKTSIYNLSDGKTIKCYEEMK